MKNKNLNLITEDEIENKKIIYKKVYDKILPWDYSNVSHLKIGVINSIIISAERRFLSDIIKTIFDNEELEKNLNQNNLASTAGDIEEIKSSLQKDFQKITEEFLKWSSDKNNIFIFNDGLFETLKDEGKINIKNIIVELSYNINNLTPKIFSNLYILIQLYGIIKVFSYIANILIIEAIKILDIQTQNVLQKFVNKIVKENISHENEIDEILAILKLEAMNKKDCHCKNPKEICFNDCKNLPEKNNDQNIDDKTKEGDSNKPNELQNNIDQSKDFDESSNSLENINEEDKEDEEDEEDYENINEEDEEDENISEEEYNDENEEKRNNKNEQIDSITNNKKVNLGDKSNKWVDKSDNKFDDDLI